MTDSNITARQAGQILKAYKFCEKITRQLFRSAADFGVDEVLSRVQPKVIKMMLDDPETRIPYNWIRARVEGEMKNFHAKQARKKKLLPDSGGDSSWHLDPAEIALLRETVNSRYADFRDALTASVRSLGKRERERLRQFWKISQFSVQSVCAEPGSSPVKITARMSQIFGKVMLGLQKNLEKTDLYRSMGSLARAKGKHRSGTVMKLLSFVAQFEDSQN